jgi:hypothetical protein
MKSCLEESEEENENFLSKYGAQMKESRPWNDARTRLATACGSRQQTSSSAISESERLYIGRSTTRRYFQIISSFTITIWPKFQNEVYSSNFWQRETWWRKP